MFDIKALHRDGDSFYANDEEIVELFPIDEWDCAEAFKMVGIRGYEPMTAKELDTEEKQDEALRDSSNILEEKFDGTRALVYFLSQEDEHDNEIGYCRVFSRRISKKTNFYVENSDSLPQIREIDVPELSGTILDGEMFIDGLPFKEVSSTLNCKWDKAIDRQIDKGFISLHAFDILFYHGIDLRRMPLIRRKEYLRLAVEEANSPYIKEVPYFECGKPINDLEIVYRIDDYGEAMFYEDLEDNKDIYPNLYKCHKENKPLTPRAYYELIVSTGGEGLIVKPKNGKYLHKRGWEYSKIKKFLTRELVVIGFDEPTREYEGKDIKNWGYWVRESDNKRVQGNYYNQKGYIAVTKHYYHNQVGVMRLGVVITDEEYESIPKNKRGLLTNISGNQLMLVCECSGFDDETRAYFTRNKFDIIGSVVEVRANELFRDSGRMRHPRYMRMRYDKEAERCTWIDHIGVDKVTK